MIAFIQKDTNANVRDAAVAVLANFKSKLPNYLLLEETINLLPKYRITEINKLVENKVSQIQQEVKVQQDTQSN